MNSLIEHLPLIIAIAFPLVMPLLLFQVLPLLVLLERRGAAFIQDRPGPNRAYIPLPIIKRLRAFGMIYNVTDLVKVLFKENFDPPFVRRGYYWVAPAIPVVIGLMTPAVIPWFAPITYQTPAGLVTIVGQMIDAHAGLLMLFALGSLSVYGIVLGSWSSNSKYALLGGMRASAMMISYEVSMGLSVLGLLLLVGSFGLTDIVEWQGAHTWGFVVQPVGFLLFLVSMFAECNRNPFDVAEGESEIVAGFHLEYSGTKFLLFMTAEYLHMLVASILIATLYFGGYHLLPFPLPLNGISEAWVHLDTAWVKANLGLVLAVVVGGLGFGLLFFSWLVHGRLRYYARRQATDRALRLREYAIYRAVFALAGLGALAGALAAGLFLHPQGAVGSSGFISYPGWVHAVTALVQFHILMGKALLFAALFVWVRWTLPRFRYDQIMALGWKVMLNIALVNLLVTAVIAKLVK